SRALGAAPCRVELTSDSGRRSGSTRLDRHAVTAHRKGSAQQSGEAILERERSDCAGTAIEEDDCPLGEPSAVAPCDRQPHRASCRAVALGDLDKRRELRGPGAPSLFEIRDCGASHKALTHVAL